MEPGSGDRGSAPAAAASSPQPSSDPVGDWQRECGAAPPAEGGGGGGGGGGSGESSAPAEPPPSPKKATRKGKWSTEEEEFTMRIIECFNSGLLSLPEGTTLRSYLADKLNCDPMRITKKFSGSSCLGKRVFHSSLSGGKMRSEPPSANDVARARRELAVLENRFVDACIRSTESKDARMIDLEARFLHSSNVVSTPAIDAFIMQSCQPLWDPDNIQRDRSASSDSHAGPKMNAAEPKPPMSSSVSNDIISSPAVRGGEDYRRRPGDHGGDQPELSQRGSGGGSSSSSLSHNADFGFAYASASRPGGPGRGSNTFMDQAAPLADSQHHHASGQRRHGPGDYNNYHHAAPQQRQPPLHYHQPHHHLEPFQQHGYHGGGGRGDSQQQQQQQQQHAHHGGGGDYPHHQQQGPSGAAPPHHLQRPDQAYGHSYPPQQPSHMMNPHAPAHHHYPPAPDHQGSRGGYNASPPYMPQQQPPPLEGQQQQQQQQQQQHYQHHAAAPGPQPQSSHYGEMASGSQPSLPDQAQYGGPPYGGQRSPQDYHAPMDPTAGAGSRGGGQQHYGAAALPRPAGQQYPGMTMPLGYPGADYPAGSVHMGRPPSPRRSSHGGPDNVGYGRHPHEPQGASSYHHHRRQDEALEYRHHGGPQGEARGVQAGFGQVDPAENRLDAPPPPHHQHPYHHVQQQGRPTDDPPARAAMPDQGHDAHQATTSAGRPQHHSAHDDQQGPVKLGQTRDKDESVAADLFQGFVKSLHRRDSHNDLVNFVEDVNEKALRKGPASDAPESRKRPSSPAQANYGLADPKKRWQPE